MTEKDLIIQDLRRENAKLRVRVQEWISVKDELPEDSGYYLVVYRDKYNGSISIAFDMYVKCNVGEWWENDYAYDVTHWMLLPEMPKGE